MLKLVSTWTFYDYISTRPLPPHSTPFRSDFDPSAEKKKDKGNNAEPLNLSHWTSKTLINKIISISVTLTRSLSLPRYSSQKWWRRTCGGCAGSWPRAWELWPPWLTLWALPENRWGFRIVLFFSSVTRMKWGLYMSEVFGNLTLNFAVSFGEYFATKKEHYHILPIFVCILHLVQTKK